MSKKLNAQEFNEQRIDSFQKVKVKSFIKEGKLEEALLLSVDLIDYAKKINYEDAIVFGYVEIASLLCVFGQHLESLRYLNLADKNVSEKNNIKLKLKIYSIYGKNYSSLKLTKKAVSYFDKGIVLSKKMRPESDNFLGSFYVNKADAYLHTKNRLDSSLVYLHKSIDIEKSPFRYAILSNYYLKYNKNIDSASHYLSKCKSLIGENTTISAYQKSIILQAQANLYKAQGDYKNAIDLYRKSLEISYQMKRYKEISISYKFIAESYRFLKEEDKAHDYLLKYTRFNDSINNQYKKNVDSVVTTFLKEQENSYQLGEKRLKTFLYGSVSTSVLALFLIAYYHKKKQRKLVIEKEEIIKKRNKENIELKQKLNSAFEEVVNLAKNNDPAFLARFQEVYPDVCEKILNINPKLVNTELTLCAMIWLNFSSKNIASYTFVQPKTVQMKKYRLRKKLQIPAEVDLYTWIKNL
ncbi:tetratricopeptide repeat protein [Aureibaculum marinum]|uniref:Tetratricopeptide repeat protein n=1 Tax=Aureibaculum marinum TaxID=2487930 RepID=A0A3N4P8F4_9FLAO|nr:tetratricopeptide repeat protein [Aureibaculum marinum]RPD99989.1 tetratricopeptide repeat protein [Aureibaculum marinum]